MKKLLPMKIQRENERFATQRLIKKVGEDLFLFENDIEIKNEIEVCHVSGPVNIISFFIMEKGEGWIEFGSSSIPMETGLALVLPNQCMVNLRTNKTKLKIVNYCSSTSFTDTEYPLVFNIDFENLPKFDDIESVRKYIDESKSKSLTNEDAHPVSVKLKEYIDRIYRSEGDLGQFQPEFDMARSTISYHFKKDFATTPKEYLSRLRVTTAIYDLISGSEVAHTAFESGFNDLSRFYKNFNKFAHATPKQYKGENKFK